MGDGEPERLRAAGFGDGKGGGWGLRGGQRCGTGRREVAVSLQSPGGVRGLEGGDGAQDLKETHWKPQMEMVGMPKGHGDLGTPQPPDAARLPPRCLFPPPALL